MAIIVAASLSQTDVAAAITSASNGDTVSLPAGSAIWSTDVNIPITKAITISGGGSYAVDGNHADTGTWPVEITLDFGASPSYNPFTINSTQTGATRITGISFKGTAGTVGFSWRAAIYISSSNTAPWRIDNCRFELESNAIYISVCGISGLIDHIYTYDAGCSMKNVFIFQDTRSDGYGDWPFAQTLGWGGSGFVFVEDCTFWKDVANISATTSMTDGQAAAKFVFRYNYVRNSMIGWHGTESSAPYRGFYAAEIYANTFYWSDSVNRYPRTILCRGGTIRVYDNVVSNYARFTDFWIARLDAAYGRFGQADGEQAWDGNWGGDYPTAYPVLDQPGTGKTTSATLADVQPQDTEKMYFWNNTLTNVGTALYCISGEGDWIVDGQDYEYSVDDTDEPSGYTPYTYPHPLRGEGWEEGGAGGPSVKNLALVLR